MFDSFELWTSAEVGKLSRVLSRRTTQLERVLDALPFGLAVLGPDANLEYANRTFAGQHPNIANLLAQVRTELAIVVEERRPQQSVVLDCGATISLYPHDSGSTLAISTARPKRVLPAEASPELPYFSVRTIDFIGAPVIVIDEAMRILAVNTAASSLLGLGAGDLVDKSYRDLDTDTPASYFTDTKSVLTTLKHSSGSQVPVEVRVRDVMNERGAAHVLTCLTHASGPTACADTMATLERVSGHVAHRLNSLLTVILSYAELIQADYGTVESLGTEVAQISEAAVAASRITQDLLTFSRGRPTSSVIIELDRAIASMASLLRGLAGPAAVRMLLHAPGVHVQFGLKELEGVLLGVVRNAKEALGDSDGTIAVETSRIDPGSPECRALLSRLALNPAAGYARIVVTDNGPGFPAEIGPHLFEPFFTTKAGANGMGLSLAYGLIKRAGGGLVVDRSSTVGTQVSIVLPQTSPQVQWD